uniref:Uncharacterized protein n=1 Tax=Quercus lobata TaxID=97700 RepID=A0A7N2KXM6_QUELO
MGVVSNKIERENLKPGDHIYSWRLAYAYSHHGSVFLIFLVYFVLTTLITNFDGNFTTISETGVTFVGHTSPLFQERTQYKKTDKVYMAPLN